MKTYELTLLLNEDYDEYKHKRFNDVLRSLCTINKITDEGVKRLTYPIDGQDKANYVEYELSVRGDKAELIEGLCFTYGQCLRYLLMRCREASAR